MQTNVIKRKLFTGVIWETIGQFLSLIIQFGVTIIIARVLLPDDFGVVGLLIVFVAIGNILLDSGFSQALIQKKEANNLDFSSVFYVNLFVGLCLYALFYVISPYIAQFYEIPELTRYARILFLIIPITSLGLIQNVLIQKQMEFRKTAIASLVAALVSGCLGIGLAYRGFGIMALVVQQITMYSVRTLMYFIQRRWLPKRYFSLKAVKEIFTFSMNLMFHSLINTVFKNIDTLIIGKYYATSEVGYYNQAKKFEEISASTITSIIVKVSFPALVQFKDDVEKVKMAYKKITAMTFFVVCPLMFLLICIAPPLFRILLTEKWMPAVPYFQLLCLYGLTLPIMQISYNIYKLYKKGKFLVRIDLIRHVLFLISILLTIKHGITTLLVGLFVVMFIMSFVNMYFSGKLINYSVKEQILQAFPYYATSFVAGVLVWILPYIKNDIITLSAYIPVFAIIYIIGAKIFKLNAYAEIQNIIIKRRI